MAADEMLLESGLGCVPTLRYYRWKSPTLSIGYFQSVKRVVEEFRCAQARLNVVRRITGGGLVRHDAGLTLSLVLPEENPYFRKAPLASYRMVHETFQKGLSNLCPGIMLVNSCQGLRPRDSSVCFEESVHSDLALDGRKVVGSSQRRRGGVLLHQTAVMLDFKPQDIASNIIEGLEKDLGINFLVTPLSEEEIRRVQRLIREKYSRGDYSFTAKFFPKMQVYA